MQSAHLFLESWRGRALPAFLRVRGTHGSGRPRHLTIVDSNLD